MLKFDTYSASSLLQQSMRRYVAPLGHIILNPSKTVWRAMSREAANTNFISPWFDSVRLKPMIYCTWDEHTKNYQKTDIIMKYTHCSKYLFNKSIALEISFCALAIVTSLFLANYNGKSLWYQYISKQMIDILNLFKIRSHHLIRPFFFFNQIYIIYLSNW